MPLIRLHHYNIWTRDLARTTAWYEAALGLRAGPRPPISTPGAWMYDPGGTPVLHIYDGAQSESVERGGGAIDHIAFEAADFEGMLARMRALGVEAATNEIGSIKLKQIFVHDPNGVKIELNFQD